MAHKGQYKPRHPEKYNGDPSKIIYRSMLEYRVMNYLDDSPSIIRWCSEEFFVPYYDPAAKRQRRYFPDFYIEYKNKHGQIIKEVIEVKPSIECSPPKKPKKVNRRYVQACFTFMTNTAKWEAAKLFCEERDWKFRLLTETDLGISWKKQV